MAVDGLTEDGLDDVSHADGGLKDNPVRSSRDALATRAGPEETRTPAEYCRQLRAIVAAQSRELPTLLVNSVTRRG